MYNAHVAAAVAVPRQQRFGDPLEPLRRGLKALGGLVLYMATVITNVGLAIVTNRILGSGTEPKYIGWGTAAGTAAAGDTTLFTEKDVDLSTGSGTRTTGTGAQATTTQTNDTYRVTGTRTATGAGTVTNAGLWDNATIGSGTLFVKGDFTGIGLASGDSIAFTFNTKFS